MRCPFCMQKLRKVPLDIDYHTMPFVDKYVGDSLMACTNCTYARRWEREN